MSVEGVELLPATSDEGLVCERGEGPAPQGPCATPADEGLVTAAAAAVTDAVSVVDCGMKIEHSGAG